MSMRSKVFSPCPYCDGRNNNCADCELQTYRALGSVEELTALVKTRGEGRVVVLPCKPFGVTVYQLRSKKHARGVGVSPRHIGCATVWANGGYALHHQGADDCLKKDLGKTWFLTRAEAEAALQKGGPHEANPV